MPEPCAFSTWSPHSRVACIVPCSYAAISDMTPSAIEAAVERVREQGLERVKSHNAWNIHVYLSLSKRFTSSCCAGHSGTEGLLRHGFDGTRGNTHTCGRVQIHHNLINAVTAGLCTHTHVEARRRRARVESLVQDTKYLSHSGRRATFQPSPAKDRRSYSII